MIPLPSRRSTGSFDREARGSGRAAVSPTPLGSTWAPAGRGLFVPDPEGRPICPDMLEQGRGAATSARTEGTGRMTKTPLNQDVIDKVQEMLLSIADSVNLVEKGTFSMRHGSARAFVQVRTREAFSWVVITIPVLVGLQETPELLDFVAHDDDYIFGHLYLERWEEGTTLMFGHSLLADYLDEAELGHAVGGMITSADRLDDELKGRFGGHRFHEDA